MKLDFVFVDSDPQGPLRCFPDYANVYSMWRPKKPKRSSDLCSYKIGLALIRPGQYKYVVLMNGEVLGPFGADRDFLKPFKAGPKCLKFHAKQAPFSKNVMSFILQMELPKAPKTFQVSPNLVEPLFWLYRYTKKRFFAIKTFDWMYSKPSVL